jgi:drug/metabolite transporter (DMT)-like permease
MTSFLQSPALLLPATGALLGLNFPLGKLAGAAGVAGPVWALLMAASACLVLGAWLLLRRQPRPLDRQHLRYFAVTAIISYALPNLLVLAVIPRLGSGMTAVFFTLSPLFTVVFSALAGLRRPSALELAGIAVGFAGALLVVSGRGEVGRPAELLWIVAGLLIPVSLAAGNVYRTLDWPKGADPLWLAVGSNAVAAGLLLALALSVTDAAGWRGLLAVPGPALLQAAGSAGMFVLFFRLQQAAGPVTLSQIGTVAAAVGVAIGALALGERYPAIVWAGVGTIVLGLSLTIAARLRGA